MDLNKFPTFSIILAILLFVYSLIMFLLFNPIFLKFRITYIFTIIAFALQFVLMYYFNQKSNNSTQIANFSAFFVVDIYLILQIIFSFVLCITLLNAVFSLIIQVIVLVIAIIIELILIQSIDYIDEIEAKKEIRIQFQKDMLKRVEILKHKYPKCKGLEDLYETIRFSNSMSRDKVQDLENNIFTNLNLLEKSLDNKYDKNTIKIINDIQEDFKERDIILKH